ncbi:PREDICTED: uncharacterized protein LOC105365090 [Ceratosolen solmsi marchali]|uniref:Uncharacterized protein LOC105365090 n=1 Tax=Ceratosolen solmsi marchali TaxID=326594 RepID=A0AAJ6YNV0_9HYME|nr:PREDICTED: uncharacterized protein LOC105365090 [Ceratosolen solmsi marchali]XP_011501478.1 PREDICTED: uncharacterized protein LOC105365090 [Ceratosolen solmsi marchali]
MLADSTLMLLLHTLIIFCAGDQWLMYGDFIGESEAIARHLVLESTNSTTSVSSSMQLSLVTPPGHRINCILAAALHMNGNVSVVEGGLGTGDVTLAYETLNGYPDLLFVLVESNADTTARSNGSRVTIIYDRLRTWGLLPPKAVTANG